MEPMSRIRRRTAEHVSLSWSQAVRVTHFDQADITGLEKLRAKYADRARKAGGNLTMAVMVVKAAALALKLHPSFNASIDMQNRRIIYKEYRHIGIAVNTPRGLLVPVIKDADRRNLIDISAEVIRLAQRARDGSIGLNELQGGTFTVTNIGNIGGRWFTPVLNYPESAILGMGRSFEEVAIVKGKYRSRTVLPLSLSYDHRLIDGADAAAFLKWIVEAIEEPLLLSLEG
jgi:pyruvate dehydrogenase E2 component (dihydrolipoamide acetyltransferase)